MQTLTTEAIGCIGKCTSGLSRKELDRITDNIQRTLSHPRGKQIFTKYLEKRDLKNEIECLNLYETCCGFIDELGKEPPLEVLKARIQAVKNMAEELDGVTEIDRALLESLVEAINSESSLASLAVLKDTRDRCRDHLKKIHRSFKKYVSEPCPLRK
nr:uncharacterized protein LOC117228593 [Megalopta genalis]XP_033340314.1 uncharacterized protein LOC117228593 [Megalopta genalis]XP_033340315.1 uncharacterized protein LOC117228593 [Megalopta genalis]